MKLFRRRKPVPPPDLGSHLQRVYWETLREQQAAQRPRRRKAA